MIRKVLPLVVLIPHSLTDWYKFHQAEPLLRTNFTVSLNKDFKVAAPFIPFT